MADLSQLFTPQVIPGVSGRVNGFEQANIRGTEFKRRRVMQEALERDLAPDDGDEFFSFVSKRMLEMGDIEGMFAVQAKREEMLQQQFENRITIGDLAIDRAEAQRKAAKDKADAKAEANKPPEFRKIRRGTKQYVQEYNEKTKKYEDVPGAVGEAFSPKAVTEINMGGTDRVTVAEAKDLRYPDGTKVQPGTPWDEARAAGVEIFDAATSTEVGQRAMIAEAIPDIERAKGIILEDGFKKDGSLDKGFLASLALLDGASNARAREAYTSMARALQTKLRIETGAQANADEIKSIISRYMPSLLDIRSPEVVRQKLNAFELFMNTAIDQADPGLAAKLRSKGGINTTARPPQDMSIEEIEAELRALRGG